MINVLLPMAGGSGMFDPQQYPYPLPLTELLGTPIIEHVVRNLAALGTPEDEVRFIFVVKAEDCRQFHLDHSLSLMVPGRCEIVRLTADTQGALCSALMAVQHIDNESPLLICNSDQLIEPGLAGLFAQLRGTQCDAGCLTFDAVHPRWSYVRLEGDTVVEAAEKKPISRHAIAGFYYFAQGARFVQAAKRAILNQSSVNGRYYVAPVLNEFVLDGLSVKALRLQPGSYHSFYTPQRIDDYERHRSAPPEPQASLPRAMLQPGLVLGVTPSSARAAAPIV